MVGVSPAIIAAGALGSLAGPVVAGAAAAGLIAFQASRQPGRQPVWYTARNDTHLRRTLEHLYMPRPKWHEEAAGVPVATP